TTRAAAVFSCAGEGGRVLAPRPGGRRLRPFGIAVLLWISSIGAADGKDVYVDAVNGSDGTGDGGVAAPWKRVSFALGQALMPGDHVWLAPGLYDFTNNGE